MKMIQMAKKGGADAVKFQTYKAELLASKTLCLLGYKKEKTRNQFELFKNMTTLKLKNMRNYINIAKKLI